jgi:hypothetical protein
MKTFLLALVCLLQVAVAAPVVAETELETGAAAQQGFEEILDLWRAERYEELYARLEHTPDKGWPYFAERIVYASRLPACCWEKLQDVQVTVTDPNTVTINAKVGFEAEGFGVRFVVRDFTLRRRNGVWQLPMQLILELANYNIQRIPRKIYEREP